ncbi:hypothetical protein B0H19DRAFT_713979 [Mycena capillaripes]|nr:hypothetical protein B0H19DRAFT_713979 [Mycena capillaripes]
MYRTTRLECWEVATGRRVWTWSGTRFPVLQTMFDLRRDFKATAFVTDDEYHLLILEADLKSGHSRELFKLTSVRAYCLPRIAGDYLGYNLRTDRDTVWKTLLINWRKKEYVIFESICREPDFSIIPGYILLSDASKPGCVRIYSISSLQRLWRPVSQFNLQSVSLELEITPKVILPAAGPASPLDETHAIEHKLHMSISESVLRPNTYLLRVAQTGSVCYIQTITTYRLSHCGSTDTLQCTLLETFAQPKQLMAISRANYGLEDDETNGVNVVLRQADQGRFIRLDGGRSARLTHNGGLVVLYDTYTTILYYL